MNISKHKHTCIIKQRHKHKQKKTIKTTKYIDKSTNKHSNKTQTQQRKKTYTHTHTHTHKQCKNNIKLLAHV